MTIQHSTITDPQIHEPKGVAAADAKTVYVADGAGSGSWQPLKQTGWGYYTDNGSGQVVGTTAVKLSINANTTILSEMPTGVSNFWDSANNKITPDTIGDAYNLRITLPITAKSGSPTAITIQLDIGGGVSPTTVIYEDYKSTSFAATPTINFPFTIYSLNTFKTNGGQLFFKVDTGTVTITSPAIFISRFHKGNGA